MGYLKKLALKRQRMPFPRQQDIPPDAVHVGLPPGRKFSLSHGWSSEMHPCPSGAKLKRLPLAEVASVEVAWNELLGRPAEVAWRLCMSDGPPPHAPTPPRRMP